MKNIPNFKGLVVSQIEDKQYVLGIQNRSLNDLPSGELLVRVHYSSLNYKDALSATGHPGVTKHFPHTPGIDAAGEVVCCDNGTFSVGDKVIVTGYDLGMETDGGWGQLIRIPSAWAIRLPDGLSLRESMIWGTAGFTAALSVMGLVDGGVKPGQGDIVVTGATGGVGSIALALLAKVGYRVVAVTGKINDDKIIRNLGAADVISRSSLLLGAERPMMKERWAGGVDVVGGDTLSAVIKSTCYGGAVTCCGMVGAADLPMNVYPFILRGIKLIGIDSVLCPHNIRQLVWERLANEWKLDSQKMVVTEVGMDGVESKVNEILNGKVFGRVIVNLA